MRFHNCNWPASPVVILPQLDRPGQLDFQLLIPVVDSSCWFCSKTNNCNCNWLEQLEQILNTYIVYYSCGHSAAWNPVIQWSVTARTSSKSRVAREAFYADPWALSTKKSTREISHFLGRRQNQYLAHKSISRTVQISRAQSTRVELWVVSVRYFWNDSELS